MVLPWPTNRPLTGVAGMTSAANGVLATIPSPDQGVWHLGPLPIRAYALCIWGAIALGAVGAWIGCRRHGVPLLVFADAVAPGIVVAQAIGRLGNYFNQELYGGPTGLPWGLEIYRRVAADGTVDPLNGIAVSHDPIAVVHPTFLYELVWNLLVAALVVVLDRTRRLGHGRAFAVYVAGYTLGRCLVEMMRTDDATHLFGVRINVWTSIPVFLGAVTYFVLARRRGEREMLASAPAAQDDGQGGHTGDRDEDRDQPQDQRPGGGEVAVATEQDQRR